MRTPFRGNNSAPCRCRRRGWWRWAVLNTLPCGTKEELADIRIAAGNRWFAGFCGKGIAVALLSISDSSSTIAALAEQGLRRSAAGIRRCGCAEPAKVRRIRDGSVGTTIVAVTMPHAELSIYAQDFLKYMEENAW